MAFTLLPPGPATAQVGPEVTPDLLEQVLPVADRFGPKRGEPPILEGFRIDNSDGSETLVGYALLTSDVSPEEYGYDGPLLVLRELVMWAFLCQGDGAPLGHAGCHAFFVGLRGWGLPVGFAHHSGDFGRAGGVSR